MHHGTCAATLELNLATRRQFHELLAVDLAIELDELAGASGYAPRDQRRCGAKAAGFSTAAISEQLTALRALEDGMLGMQHRIGVLRAERTQAGAERGGPHGCAHADDDDGTSSLAGSDISATDSEISAATTVSISFITSSIVESLVLGMLLGPNLDVNSQKGLRFCFPIKVGDMD